MLIKEDSADIATPNGSMRVHRFQPAGGGPFPGLILFSEIFQVTGPIQRTARRLASHGYLVAAPEVYHEFEPAGCALAYDKDGTDKGNRYKIEKELAAYDADARAVIAHLKSLPQCTGKLGSIGICLGGHLSFRCAMNPEILAGVCLYATDIHKRSLGKGMQDDSLDRIPELKGEMLMIYGKQDPHVPQEGRDLIYRTMTSAGVDFTWHEFNAQHAFIRDEGPRYDAALADICYALALELFGRRLQTGFLEAPAGAAPAPGPLKLG
ncbi:MAG: Dienelactone hydrolase [Fibrobacteres bacterium]|nr:Dienelactone hydrolase [Fibrobacterota bacterium]